MHYAVRRGRLGLDQQYRQSLSFLKVQPTVHLLCTFSCASDFFPFAIYPHIVGSILFFSQKIINGSSLINLVGVFNIMMSRIQKSLYKNLPCSCCRGCAAFKMRNGGAIFHKLSLASLCFFPCYTQNGPFSQH